jgi:molybdopterin converting factor small subunit
MTETATIQLRLRFFASSRAAMGRSELTTMVPAGSTIDSVLASVSGGDEALCAVLARCSFLVGGVATTDRDRLLADGDIVEVLPPFAGG